MDATTDTPWGQSGRITVGQTADGTVTYLVDMAPEDMPAVRLRDLAAAWESARAAALAERWGARRLFRFRRADGGCTDLALADADAGCWAEAVDATVGLRSLAGLSVCLRLLALVDVLSQVRWAAAMLVLRRDGAELDQGLLQAAATIPLSTLARFDPARLRAALPPRLAASAVPPRPAFGASP